MKDYNSTIERCKKGDKDAFRTIVMDFQQMIFRLAIKIICDEAEAEDIVQETFINAWLSIKSFNNKSSLKTWLYRITCNKCYDRLRQMKNKETMTDSIENMENIQYDNDMENDISNKELCRLISLYTKDMPPMHKLVFTLKDMEDLPSDEICKITGITSLQLKSNLYFARKFIRNKFQKEKPL